MTFQETCSTADKNKEQTHHLLTQSALETTLQKASKDIRSKKKLLVVISKRQLEMGTTVHGERSGSNKDLVLRTPKAYIDMEKPKKRKEEPNRLYNYLGEHGKKG